MKRILVLTMIFTLTGLAKAQVWFFDNFEQFSAGTNMLDAAYVPTNGMSAHIGTNEMNSASITATITNLAGNKALAFVVPVNGDLGYRAQLSQMLSNQIATISWWMQFTTQAASSVTGGVVVDITDTNVWVDNNFTNYSSNPLVFFGDCGKIFAFTNPPSPTPPYPLIEIGTWNRYVGHMMTNTLTIDYPNRTYELTINDRVVTNLPLPGYVANLLHEVQLEDIQFLPAAAGDSVLIDKVKISTPVKSVSSYLIAKGKIFTQTADGVSQVTTGWLFHADVNGVDSNSITGVNLGIPSHTVQPLSQDSYTAAQWQLNVGLTSSNQLNTDYPSGTYTATVTTATDTLASALLLTGNAYPPAPQILNFAAAQAVAAGTNFSLHWSLFTNATARDSIMINISDDRGYDPFTTPNYDSPQVLAGTNTMVVIPADTLLAGTIYNGQIIFLKHTSSNTTDIADALGIAGYFSITYFSLGTVLPTVTTPVIAPNGGTFTNSVSVSLSCTTTGAVIHYTLDDTTPTAASISYAGPIGLTNSATIKTLAVAAGYNNSAVASANFIIVTPSPSGPACTVIPASGTNAVNTTYEVIALVTSNAVPVASATVSFNVITGPNTGQTGVSQTGGDGRAAWSYTSTTTGTDVIRATGIVNDQAFTGTASVAWSAPGLPSIATPTIDPASGTFTNSVKVLAICSTAKAVLRYTVNGIEPTGRSPVYNKTGLTITTNTTLKVKAFKGTNTSATATAEFVIYVPPAPVIDESPLPSAIIKTPYTNGQFRVTNDTGVTPLKWTWTAVKGSKLPTGLKLNATTGVITGTPTKADTFNFIVKVTDAKKRAATPKQFTLTVEQPATQ